MTVEERRERYRLRRYINHAETLAKEAKWRAEHREYVKATAKKWRERHPAQAASMRKIAYWAKRDELVEKKRAYNAQRREEIRQKSRERDALNREKKLRRAEHYRERNRDELRAKNRRYTRQDPARECAKVQARNAAKTRAMPKWADRDALREFYERASEMSRATGEPYHVDHMIPLRHAAVCGLHVPWNLQIITREENCKKSNRFQSPHHGG